MIQRVGRDSEVSAGRAVFHDVVAPDFDLERRRHAFVAEPRALAADEIAELTVVTFIPGECAAAAEELGAACGAPAPRRDSQSAAAAGARRATSARRDARVARPHPISGSGWTASSSLEDSPPSTLGDATDALGRDLLLPMAAA